MSTELISNVPPAGGGTEISDGETAAALRAAQAAADAGGPPPMTAGRTAIPGAFDLDEKGEFAGDNFNLKPLEDRPGIPEDQRKVSHEVYAVRNTLKFLSKTKNKLAAIAPEDYTEFIDRVKQAARVGCVGSNVDTSLAASALNDIRGDIVRRYGRKIAFLYLLALAAWAAAGVVLGFIVIGISQWSGIETLSGYGYLLVGSMVGAWLSVAASRWEIAFDGIQEFADMSAEPPVRLLFVGLLAMAFGLFLQLGIIPINIDKVPLATFSASPQWALFLGIIAGVGEKGLSMQLLTRAKQVFTTTS
jgi:hypothetical protein